MSTKAAMRPPTTTKKTVPQGQSSRMAKGRAAQSKAAANKAAVAKLNESAEIEPNKGARVAKARKEEVALKAWLKGGKKGPKPFTANYDAVSASYDAKLKGKPDPHATPKAKGARGTRSPRKLEGEALDRAKKAYDLRVKGQSFSEIAEKVGYPKPSLCRRAVVAYARQNGQPDPVARRSAKAAERFAGAPVKGFTPVKPVRAARPAKKAPAKPSGAVKKQTPGAKARAAATASERAKAGVKPIPKKAPAKQSVAAARRTRKTVTKR